MTIANEYIPDEKFAWLLSTGKDAIIENMNILPAYPLNAPIVYRYPYPSESSYPQFVSDNQGLNQKLIDYLSMIEQYPAFDLHSGIVWRSIDSESPTLGNPFQVVFLAAYYKLQSLYPNIPKPDRFGNLSHSKLMSWLISIENPVTVNIIEADIFTHSNIYTIWPRVLKYDKSGNSNSTFFQDLDSKEEMVAIFVLRTMPVITSFVTVGITTWAFASHPWKEAIVAESIIVGYILGTLLRNYLSVAARTTGILTAALYGVFKGRIFETILWLMVKLVLLLLNFLAYLIFMILPFLKTLCYKEWQGILNALGLDIEDNVFPVHYYADLLYMFISLFFVTIFLGSQIPFTPLFVLGATAIILFLVYELGVLGIFSII